MRLKFIIFTLCVISSFVLANAKNKASIVDIRDNDLLRLEYVGTHSKKVTIGGQERSKGTFYANNTIKLNEKEYLRVTNIRTGRQFYLSGKGFRLLGTYTASSFIRKRYAIDKGASSDDFRESIEAFPWQMVNDTILIHCPLLLDNDHGFTLTYIPTNQPLPPIPQNQELGEILLTKSYFQENGIFLDDKMEFRFHIDYWNTDKATPISDNFIIQYIPFIK